MGQSFVLRRITKWSAQYLKAFIKAKLYHRREIYPVDSVIHPSDNLDSMIIIYLHVYNLRCFLADECLNPGDFNWKVIHFLSGTVTPKMLEEEESVNAIRQLTEQFDEVSSTA